MHHNHRHWSHGAQANFFKRNHLAALLLLYQGRNTTLNILQSIRSTVLHTILAVLQDLGLVPNRIVATGGASQNASITKVISDVFGVPGTWCVGRYGIVLI